MNDFPKTANVVIAGGGVIGLAVARALTLCSVKDVLVIERGTLGAEASSAAAGMLAPRVYFTCSNSLAYKRSWSLWQSRWMT